MVYIWEDDNEHKMIKMGESRWGNEGLYTMVKMSDNDSNNQELF